MTSPHRVAADPAPPPLTALLSVLEHQRRVLERLQLVATTLRLLLATGDSRFLAAAVDEHEALWDRLHTLEAVRAMHAEHLAEVCGASGSGLPELAAHLDAEAAEDLRSAGRELAGCITELAETRQDASGLAGALSERSGEIAETLSWGAPDGYDGAGAHRSSGSAGTRPASAGVWSAAAPVWVDARV